MYIWADFPLSNDRPITGIVSQRRILMRLSVQVSEFVIGFIEASKILVFNIFFNGPTKKFKNHWRMYVEKVLM
jgi:hypothetical protein